MNTHRAISPLERIGALAALLLGAVILWPAAAGAEDPPKESDNAPLAAMTRDAKVAALKDNPGAVLAVDNERLAGKLKVAENDRDAATAKAVAAIASAKKEEVQKEEAKLTLADIKSGKLVSYGVTGGVSVALQWGTNTREVRQWTPAVTTMPYVAVLPAYWFEHDVTRKYCASSWTGEVIDAIKASQQSAQKHAEARYTDAVALLRAQRKRENAYPLADHQKTEARIAIADAYLAPRVWLDSKDGDTLLRLIVMVEASITDPDDAKREELKKSAIAAIASGIRNAARTSNCWWNKFGLWAGIPLEYSSTVAYVSSAEGEPNCKTADAAKSDCKIRKVSPKLAFGAAFMPNAYVSLLFGATFGTAPSRDAAPDADGSYKSSTERILWSLTLGVGGNLDIVGMFGK
jgi:hypothetical protein